MRVLVTGGSGFIGTALCRALLARGDEVHSVSRRDTAPAGAVAHVADLGDRGQVQALVDDLDPEAIIHLAGSVSGGRAIAANPPAFEVTLGSTVHLLEVAAGRPRLRRVVLAGSLEEAGGDVGPPASPYAVAKTAGRLWAQMAWAHWRVPMVWARLFMVYGPGQRDVTKLVPAACRALLGGTALPTSSGNRPVDWIYVDDVVRGLKACLDRPGLEGHEVDLGSGQLITVRALLEQLHGLVPGAPAPLYGALPDRAFEVVRSADATATARLLDWSASVELEAGLAATLEWVRESQACG